MVNQLASEDEDDAVWKARAEALLEATHGVRLGLYECPKPYHRQVLASFPLLSSNFFFYPCEKNSPAYCLLFFFLFSTVPRLLTPELLAWAASTGRFLFHKDTCRQRKVRTGKDQTEPCPLFTLQITHIPPHRHPAQPIAAKLEATRDYEDFRFYNANVATLLFSLHQGAACVSSIFLFANSFDSSTDPKKVSSSLFL